MERKRMGRLLAAFVVALMATLGLVLGLGLTAYAKYDPVKYLDANGKEQTCTDYSFIDDHSKTIGGWCVVKGKVTLDWYLDFETDTHIILCDGAELNVEGLEPSENADVPPNLTIYAQSTGNSMGKLVSADRDDGIEADTLTINGGVIEAEGRSVGLTGATSVIINGGKVTGTGNYGIVAYSVMINGGTVTTACNEVCIYAIGGELTIAKGISVIEGDDEASAQPVADPSTWKPSKKWARTTVTVPVTSVELSPATATLEPGKTVTLKATVKPDDASDKSVTWTSSDEKVATVKDGVVTAVAPGEATVTATSVDNAKATATCAVTVKAAPGPEPKPTEGQDMFRLYNPYSGEHFYTASGHERDVLVGLGWQDEGVGWVAPAEGAPVYRLYNPYAGDHHYTLSAFERDMLTELGWVDEGVGWQSAGENGVPVYRQYNPYATTGTHNYTTSEEEATCLVKLGWMAEGIGWYGL